MIEVVQTIVLYRQPGLRGVGKVTRYGYSVNQHVMSQRYLSVVDSLLAPRDMSIVFKAKSDAVEVNKPVFFNLSQKQVIEFSLLYCVRLRRFHVNGHTIQISSTHSKVKRTYQIKSIL